MARSSFKPSLHSLRRPAAVIKADGDFLLSKLRNLLVLLLLAWSALSCSAAKRVTAEQLEQMLAAAHGTSDIQMAAQLADLVLTERLSKSRLARCETDLPGPYTRQTLMALADEAEFLDLPAAEIPATVAPDAGAQRQLMAMTVNYVIKTVHLLPNFFATRTTTSFQPAKNRPWFFIGRSSAQVVYRKGEEVVDRVKQQAGAENRGLATSGEFGPILGTAMLDAAQSDLSWSHWEQGSEGTEAVFSFSVPAAKSHYELQYCCVERFGSLPVPFRAFSGYHGEIAVDPANGTILRLVLRADLKKSDPFSKADIFVEYGPVEIGGKTYICPLKSGAYSVSDWREIGTWLNDVVFEQYHVYRASTRILP
jgi:hypothetical protein